MGKLTRKRQAFIEAYLCSWNATNAALCAGYSERGADRQGSFLLGIIEVQEAIKRRLQDKAMAANEVLSRLADQARADLGVFFKQAERWTEHPGPSEEILDSSDEYDDKGKKHTLYRVRAVVLDMEKLTDPHYSHLVKKFSDSPKNGLSIELHGNQSALELIGRNLGMFKDKVEVTGAEGGAVLLKVVEQIVGDSDSNDPTAQGAGGVSP